MVPSAFVIIVVAGWSVAIADLYDANDWSLRAEHLTRGPYLVGEAFGAIRIKVTLLNKSEYARLYPPFKLAILSTEMVAELSHPDGHRMRITLGNPPGPSQRIAWVNMEGGKSTIAELTLRDFGYIYTMSDVGKYKARLVFATPQGKVAAFPWSLEVVEPAAADILSSQSVPLEGYQLKWPKEKQKRAVVQQIQIGNKTWLVYRQFSHSEKGGEVSDTYRIAELPGKVLDMKVEGAFGDGNPLTITYRATTYTKFTTTHIISSNGYPWTAEEEKHRQEKLKREGKLPAEKK